MKEEERYNGSFLEDDEKSDSEQELTIIIDSVQYTIESVEDSYHHTGLSEIRTEDGQVFIIGQEEDFEDMIRDYWENMDFEEIAELVGAERIVDYWVNDYSFSSFVDDIVDEYERHVPSYDNIKRWIESNEELDEYLGYTPEVAFLQ